MGKNADTKIDPEQRRAPLFEALLAYARSRKVSFHTPGHKHGRGMYGPMRRFLGSKVFAIDLTLLEEVDSLHNPKSVIRDAHRLAARAFGGDESYFLVNGTSVGNQAMFWSTLREGDKVIMPRNAHRSAFAGLILTGAQPVYITPPILEDWGIYGNVEVNQVMEALKANPGAQSVLVMNPTYYGQASDLSRIVAMAHRAGAVMLVDEAHGPHFAFHEALPSSAMSCGADLAAQSTHKILGAMTQASMLHMKAGRIDKSRLRMALQMLQTTSPSYILMASLDVARLQMAVSGHKLMSRVIEMARETAAVINKIPGVKCFGPEHCGAPGAYQFDQTRLLVHFDWAVTGFEVAHRLRLEFKLQAEMADVQNVLFLVGTGNTWGQMKRLSTAIRKLEKAYRGLHNNRLALPLPSLQQTKNVLTPREALFGRTRRVPLSEASGEVSAELLCPYPPGIPLLAPGEFITKEVVEYLASLVRSGGRLNGQADASGRFVRIVEAPLSSISRGVDFDKMLAFVLNENAPGTEPGKRGSS